MSNYNKQGDYIISYNNHYSFNYELKDIPCFKILTLHSNIKNFNNNRWFLGYSEKKDRRTYLYCINI